MNESALIGKTEKFLNSIQNTRIKKEIDNFPDFISTYNYLKRNLEKLQKIRDTMEIKGYKAPYRSMMKYGRFTGEMKVEDVQDITRHSQYFRMRAAAKKNILDRVKSSISSHKIAIGHLEEFGSVECDSCHRRYRGHEIADVVGEKCECGENKLNLNINQGAVSRLDILSYLPLSGDYMVKMAELSALGRESFRGIVRILKQEKRGAIKTLSLVIKVWEDNHWVRKRVQLDTRDQLDYEREVRRKYGSNARIEFIQFHRKKPAIINDKQVQTALALSYALCIQEKVGRIYPRILKNHLNNFQAVKTYKKIIEDVKRSIKMKERITDDDIILKEMINNRLSRENMLNREGSLKSDIESDLKKEEKLAKQLYVELPKTLILWDIIKYYLTTSYDRRIKHSGPFPNLRPNLDQNQMKAFTGFNQEVICLIEEYLDEKIPHLTDPQKVLSEKFANERKIKGLHLKMNPSFLGAITLNTVGKLSLEESALLLNLDPEMVSKEKKRFETFQKPSTKKAQKFLEMIKE